MSNELNNPKQIYQFFKRYFLEQGLINFYEYLKILDESLMVKEQEISANIELHYDYEQSDEGERDLLDAKIMEEQIRGFSNLLRQSFLVSLYSFMEMWLVRECYNDSKRRDNGQSFRSTRGKGVNKAKEYFSTVTQNTYNFGSQDWFWITNLKLLRDAIVHRHGSLTGFSDFPVNQKLLEFIRHEDGLDLIGVNNNQIFIDRSFCIKALGNVRDLLVDLLTLRLDGE